MEAADLGFLPPFCLLETSFLPGGSSSFEQAAWKSHVESLLLSACLSWKTGPPSAWPGEILHRCLGPQLRNELREHIKLTTSSEQTRITGVGPSSWGHSWSNSSNIQLCDYLWILLHINVILINIQYQPSSHYQKWRLKKPLSVPVTFYYVINQGLCGLIGSCVKTTGTSISI